ncbi:hypothetical protein QNI16_14575 [Cytophagaceae bacterium YF14B1]|uniref:Uncharacterized protein n=1 Tax=Xanthocytophaga flava TaxID=3048013 RepID=A0AAE3QLV7_9BACT|nr:hypothetical protein [Xanthocytophaga flavus]MDJ1481722.1 hypothetical protein [Xanthocytophaga flavus]
MKIHILTRELIDVYNDIINIRSLNELADIFSIQAQWIAGDPMNLHWNSLAHIQEALPNNVEKIEIWNTCLK